MNSSQGAIEPVRTDVDEHADVHSISREKVLGIIHELSKLKQGSKQVSLRRWRQTGDLKDQEEAETEFENIKEKIACVHESLGLVHSIYTEGMDDLAKMNRDMHELESILTRRRQIVIKARDFFDSVKKWRQCSSFVDSLLADSEFPADLVEVKSIKKNMQLSQRKLHWWLEEVKSARTLLMGTVQNAERPLSTLAIENLVYINFTMRDLIAEANKGDKRVLESQHTLKTWSNIFRNELDAKQIGASITALMNELFSLSYEGSEDLLKNRMSNVLKAYRHVLGRLIQAKQMRALLNADTTVSSAIEEKLCAAYSAFTDLYAIYVTG